MIQYIGGGSTPTGKLQDIVFDAKKNGDYAKQQGDYAKVQGDAAKTATTNANNAASNAITQATYAKSQGDYAKSVADANKTTWKTPVSTYSAIATTYPTPQLGWAVMTLDDGKIYRYDGSTWQLTQQYNSTALNNLANELSKQNQQSTAIGHGLNIINATENSPLDIRIEGRTLVNVSQNVLDPAKYYVVADKKSKVKFSDGTTYAGVAKFAGKAEKPILIRISNFENKVSGSTVENPHVVKYNTQTSLQQPSTGSEGTQTHYDNIKTLSDSKLFATTINSNGAIAQQTYSFNLIEAIERNDGKIPANDTAGKVAWLKNNINSLTIRWNGYGTSPTGNKASLSVYNNTTLAWVDTVNHMNGNVTQLTISISGTSIADRIDPNGFIHFNAYADPSNGTVASTIYTDYVELERELKQNAQLWNPRFPLYEVDGTTEYPNILTTWDENEVMRRYPMVESVQHVQNPYVIAEGDNLIPPFTDSAWTIHANASVTGPYSLALNATAQYQMNSVSLNALPNQTYTFSVNQQNGAYYYGEEFDANGTKIGSTIFTTYNLSGSVTKTFTTSPNTKTIKITATNSVATGTFTFSQPMLNLGSTAKPFVPRNPSYLYAETKLGAIGDKKDILFKDNGDWKVLKWIEKDYVLDGKLSWAFDVDGTGFKSVRLYDANTLTPFAWNDTYPVIVIKNNGILLTRLGNITFPAPDNFKTGSPNTGDLYLTVSDTDSGWGETYTPTTQEIQAYFYGWQMNNGTFGTPYNGSGTKTWVPIGDTDNSRAVTTCPTSASPTILEGKIGYYKLSYVLATPQTVVVTDKVEGDIVVNGATQVEVGSGVIVREKVTPFINGNGEFYVNDKTVGGTSVNLLKNRTDKIINMYKNGIQVSKSDYFVVNNSNRANGLTYIYAPKGFYDPTAEYTVTYLLLDRQSFTTNVLNVTATYANNIRSALDDTIKRVEDNTTNISIQARILYDILKRLKAGGL
ncbi:hypothetical protein [Bacillus smithii]|uniref:hypothetical protein n=1 Tax=Bacillus smithii TaxID=1479 RepID=UPI003D20903F